MKLKFLFVLSLGLTTFVHAQSIKSTYPGQVFDSFDSATDYVESDGLGIYLSKDIVSNNIPYYKRIGSMNLPYSLKDGTLKSLKERKGDGKVSYTVSQPYGLFEPHVGVSFGENKSINLNSDLYLQVGLKINRASMPRDGVRIFFTLIDKNRNKINSKGPNGGTTNQWKDEIAINVSKIGEFSVYYYDNLHNDMIKFNTTPDSITFITVNFGNKISNTLGYEVIYPKMNDKFYIEDELCVADIRGDENVKGASKPNTKFSPDSVNGFSLAFVNKEMLASDCYYNQTLTDLKFDLTYFKISTENDILTFSEENEVTKIKQLTAYPNPIKDGYLNLSQNSENVKVYDAMGNMVFTANSVSKINVDGFAKGLYVLKSAKGSTRFVVE